MRAVKLLDGREVDSSSEDWRHETEARAIAARPTLGERRMYLDEVERKRGKGAADRLRRTISELWELRQSAATNHDTSHHAKD
jgi:hypothetical protein